MLVFNSGLLEAPKSDLQRDESCTPLTNLTGCFGSARTPTSESGECGPSLCIPDRLRFRCSYGVILWELITLAWPWHETDGDQGRSLSSEEERPPGVPGAENGVPEPDATHRQPRDPFYVVLQNVTRGDRLEFPPDSQIKPHLTQLPQVSLLAA